MTRPRGSHGQNLTPGPAPGTEKRKCASVPWLERNLLLPRCSLAARGKLGALAGRSRGLPLAPNGFRPAALLGRDGAEVSVSETPLFCAAQVFTEGRPGPGKEREQEA